MAQWIPGSKGDGGGAQEEPPGEEQPGEEALPAYDAEDAAAAEQQAADAAAEQDSQFFHDEHADGDGAGANGGGGGDAAADGGADAATGGGAGGGAVEQAQPATALGKAKRLLSRVLGALRGQKAPADVSGPVAELVAKIDKLGKQACPPACLPVLLPVSPMRTTEHAAPDERADCCPKRTTACSPAPTRRPQHLRRPLQPCVAPAQAHSSNC